MGRLYAVEEKARQENLGPAARHTLRQEQSAPVMAALQTRLVEIADKSRPEASWPKRATTP